MPENYKLLYMQMKKLVEEYQDKIVPELREMCDKRVEVVRCKECRWAKPYERNDGETGYCCHFCGHAFKYGANWERLYVPIKEAEDFCSYGERKDDVG